jgi:hypothetical protein
VREENLIGRPLGEHVDGTHDVPSAGRQCLDELLPNVVIGEQEKAAGH